MSTMSPGKRMKISRFTVLSVAMVLAGCSSMSLENKRVDYKADAARVSTLEVPPDLTTPAAEDHYTIPDASGTASYSDFAKGSALSQARASAVLPETRKVRMERDGQRRWLVVEDKAENIWPVIKEFWQESGFPVKVEDSQAGIMETDWAENRAKLPKTGLRSLLGKVIDGIYDSGERDMYRLRLERSKDGNSTEIYITQYGKEEVLSGDKTLSKWQSRPNDPDLEVTMLQMLMAKLGGAEAMAQAKAQAAVAPETPAASMKTQADGSGIILLNEPFDRSWRKVGLALEHEGLVVEDRDRSKGIYFLRVQGEAKTKGLLDKMAFWRKEESVKSAHYRVAVRETGAGCEVTVSEEGGGSDADTRRIMDSLYKALR